MLVQRRLVPARRPPARNTGDEPLRNTVFRTLVVPIDRTVASDRAVAVAIRRAVGRRDDPGCFNEMTTLNGMPGIETTGVSLRYHPGHLVAVSRCQRSDACGDQCLAISVGAGPDQPPPANTETEGFRVLSSSRGDRATRQAVLGPNMTCRPGHRPAAPLCLAKRLSERAAAATGPSALATPSCGGDG